jgi:hypothetical protein
MNDVQYMLPIGLIGLIVAFAGWLTIRWDGKRMGRRWLPPGTVVHLNGIPIRLVEQTLAESESWHLIKAKP